MFDKKDVIKIFYNINKKVPSKLLMIGDGPERIEAEQLCRNLGITPHVRFMGKLKSVERFLVTNGDVLTTQSLNPIIKMHSKNLSTATVMAVAYPSQYGIIESQENGLIKKFSEKSRIPFFINGGIYIFERSIYNLLPEIGDHEVSTFPKLVKDKKISAYYSNNFWTSIETYKDLQEVQEKFKTGKIKF